MAMATAASLSGATIFLGCATATPSSRCHAHPGFIRLVSATFFNLSTSRRSRQRSVLQSALRSSIRATGEASAVSTQEESAESAAPTQEQSVGSAASTEEEASAAPTQGEFVADAGQQGSENGVAEDVEQQKPRVVYPKGLNRYETMAVLRPDITEEQRLALSQRYEENIIATGGMDVEIFNRGIMPLAYAILRTNTQGEKSTYVDGIYYMFTYATKPASQKELQKKLEKDDDLIRVMTFKLK